MAFIAPLFLLGALLITLPVWLHRLQTKSSKREQFSSAMLLKSAEQQVHVKKAFRYLVLLAMRIALLALLALAFAKPFWERQALPQGTAKSGTVLLLMDLSMSMGRGELLAEAQSVARRVIDSTSDDSALLILAADDKITVAGALEDDPSGRRGTVSSLGVSSLRLDLGQIMASIEAYAEGLPAPITLHVVSDFQVSAMPARFADLVPAGISELVLHPLASPRRANWSIEFVRQIEDGIEAGIRGDGDTDDEFAVSLTVNDVETRTQNVSARRTQVVEFTGMKYESGDNRVAVILQVDDVLAEDNRWHFVVENSPPTPVPLITRNSAGLPVTYLSAALEAGHGNYQLEPLQPGQFDTRILSRYPWLMIDDIGMLDSRLESALRDYLQRGGNVLAFAGDRAAGMEILPLSDHRLGTASLSSGGFLSIGQIETTHPVLRATEGWHSVNVSRSLPIEEQADDQVLIRLENDLPLLLERKIGAGRLLLVANGVDNRWNDLPLRPVFAAFISEAASYLSGVGKLSKIFTAGDRLPLSLIGSASGQVVDPQGNTVLSLAGTTRAQLIYLDKPGIYEVYTPQGEGRIAVNVDPRESQFEPLDDAVMSRWREAVAGQQVPEMAGGRPLPAAPFELWHWLLLMLALLVIGESALGNWHIRTRAG